MVSMSANDTPDQIEVFLINITTKKLYAEKHHFSSTWGAPAILPTKLITEKVFNNLARGKTLQ
jgi:hypothetical protein